MLKPLQASWGFVLSDPSGMQLLQVKPERNDQLTYGKVALFPLTQPRDGEMQCCWMVQTIDLQQSLLTLLSPLIQLMREVNSTLVMMSLNTRRVERGKYSKNYKKALKWEKIFEKD